MWKILRVRIQTKKTKTKRSKTNTLNLVLTFSILTLILYFLDSRSESILTSLNQLNLSNRFSEFGGFNDPRIIKGYLALTMWFESFSSFLWGVPAKTIESTSFKGIIWSDNSFFLLALQFGLIGLLIWILALKEVLPWGVGSSKYIYLFWVFLSLAITNAIVWDSYIFCLIFFLLCEQEILRTRYDITLKKAL